MVSKIVERMVNPDAGWTFRQAFFVAFVVSCLVSFTGVFDHSVWRPDEPRVAAIGWQMAVSGDLVVPTLGGEPFLEKPPLYWWVMSGLFHIFGVSDGVARATSAFAGILLLLLVFDVTRRVADPFAGVMAVIVTATTGKFYGNFHKVIVDPWLALFVMAGYWSFICYTFADHQVKKERNAASPLWIVVFYCAAGLAFLTKGPIGPVLLGGPVAVAVVVGKRWNFLRSWAHIPGAGILLLLCALWPTLLYNRGGWELLQGFVVGNIFQRFMPETEGVWQGGHKNPFWYYLKSAPSGLLPWLLALPAVVLWIKSSRWPSDWNRPALLLLASIFPVGLIILSIPGTKRGLYLLPLFAPLGIIVAAWLTATARSRFCESIDRYTAIVLMIVTTVVLCGGVVLALVIYFSGEGIVSKLAGTMHFRPYGVSFGTHVAILLAVVGLMILFGLRIWNRNPERVGLVAAWALLTVYVLGAPLLFTLGDGFNNLHVMTAEIKKYNAFSPNLTGYRLDETLRGLIPYDTGLVVENLTTPDALRTYCLGNSGAHVITVERRRRRLPEDIVAQLQRVKEWRYSKKRSYVLYRIISDTEKIDTSLESYAPGITN